MTELMQFAGGQLKSYCNIVKNKAYLYQPINREYIERRSQNSYCMQKISSTES
jgi:hypothetical protein